MIPDFQASVIGSEAVAEKFLHAGDEIRQRLRSALAKIGDEVAGRAKAEAPSRTGDLRDSIAPLYIETLTTQREAVRAGELYALFVEHGVVNHGTKNNRRESGGKRKKLSFLHQLRAAGAWRIQPHPFLSKALASLRAQIESDLEAAVSDGADATEG